MEWLRNIFVWFAGPYMPVDGGGFAHNVDFLVGFIAVVCYFFVAVIGTLMVLFSVKYRQRNRQDVGQGAHHSTPLEIAWTLPPVVIVVYIFAVGFTGFMDMATPPAAGNAFEVRAEAYRWGWNFYYPNGASDTKLYIPSDRPTKITLESKDVIHCLYVPAFRAKKDIVPGRYNVMWFEPKADDVSPAEGQTEHAYDLHCAEYCGDGHSQMNTECIVVESTTVAERMIDDQKVMATAFDAKMAEINVWNKDRLPPVELGKLLYSGGKGGCIQCHSIDGSRKVGPSWKDLYGDPHVQFSSGELGRPADDNYILESIRNPNAKIVAGFTPQMSPYGDSQLNAGDVRAIIEYMKTISVHAGNKPTLEAYPEGYEGKEELSGEGKGEGGSGAGDGAKEEKAE